MVIGESGDPLFLRRMGAREIPLVQPGLSRDRNALRHLGFDIGVKPVETKITDVVCRRALNWNSNDIEGL